MTTAHRPTFDPARGKEPLRGPGYHQITLPAHLQLKFRKAGQGGAADAETRDLRAELLAAEAAHFQRKNPNAPPPAGLGPASDRGSRSPSPDAHGQETSAKRARTESTSGPAGEEDEEDLAAKRRRILEETRDIDADDTEEEEDDDDDDSDSDDDSDAELQRELERVRREKAERREREERERLREEEDQRERDIALGNPLLNKPDFSIRRRWDDDVVFKNQARGTDDRGKKKEFVNDMLRSDFHRRFMNKYVR